MIAFLGMYDLPALQEANDRFWTLIRDTLGDGPARLSRGGDPWAHWQSPDLVFAQTCGMPYRTRLHGHVTLVATPDYGLDGCPAGHYRSALVVRTDDPRQTVDAFAGARFAYNEALSQSGWAAPIAHLRAHGAIPGDLLETGAHAASARAVAEGRADLAGIDALTWELLCAHDPPLTRSLRALAWTEPTPGLPFITALGRDPAPIREAVARAIGALNPQDRAALHLRGLVWIGPQDYLAIPSPPLPAL